MFSYAVKAKYLPIPRTGGRFWITREGCVFDIFVGEWPIKPTQMNNGELVVEFPIETPYGFSVSLNFLIALAFKPIYLPLDKLQNFVSVECIEQSNNPISPINLLWRYGESGIECDLYPGFHYIPNFSRYLIDRKGIIVSTFSGEICEPYLSNTGYFCVRITRDDNIGIIYPVHRLVASAFLHYPLNVDKMTVNHINMEKTYNDKDNLEWLTIGDNNRHARLFNSHLKAKPIEIIVTDIHKKKDFVYPSLNDVAKKFDVGPSAIWQAINLGSEPRVFKGRYLVRSINMPPHPHPESLLNKPQNGRPRAVLVTDVNNSTSTRYKKAIDFVKAYDGLLTRKQIYKRLKNGDTRPINGLSFHYDD